MENFTYTDIFDTKGIEYIIILVFFMLLIPFWRLLNRPLKARAPYRAAEGVLSYRTVKLPGGLLYGKNHTWAHMEKAGLARLGINDLLLQITGNVNIKYAIKAGDKIKRGDTLAFLNQNGKELIIRSPMTGEIMKVNDHLHQDPSDLNEDPYGNGWLVKIKPKNWLQEVQTCLFGEQVMEWTKNEITRIKDFIVVSTRKYEPEPAMVALQEGGELRNNLLSEMEPEIWEDFQDNFLKL